MHARARQLVASLRGLPSLTAATLTMYGGGAFLLVIGVITWTPGKNPRWVIMGLAAVAIAFFCYTIARGARLRQSEALAMAVVQFAAIGAITWTTDLTLAAYANGSVLPIVGVYAVWFLDPVVGRIALYSGTAWWFVAVIHHDAFVLVGFAMTLVVQTVLAAEIFSRIKMRMDRLARTDSLTGLLNRRGIHEAADREFALARRRGHDVAVVSLDLDGLREVNNSRGHSAGDALLEAVARHWTRMARRQDAIGRTGGDEFLFVLPRTSFSAAELMVQRMSEGSPGSWSAGIATMKPGDTVASVLDRADERMYVRKEGRRTDLPQVR